MKDHRVQVTLPDTIYEPLHQIAEVTGMSLDEVIIQTIKGGMPPSLKKVPSAFHDELLSLNKMNDTQLWDVIQGKVKSTADYGAAHEHADFPMLRRAYAFSLLKWRGHPVPSPHEMILD